MNQLTDKEIKLMVVYGEGTKHLSNDDKFRYDAFYALWQEFTSVFINDETITPVIPKQN